MKTIIVLTLVLLAAVCNAAETDGSAYPIPDTMPELVEPGGMVPTAPHNNGERGVLGKPLSNPNESAQLMPKIEVNGRVTEKGTRKLLADISVYIKEADGKRIVSTLSTDQRGRFSGNLPQGKYQLIVAAMGYDKYQKTLEVKSESIVDLRIRLMPKVINPYQMVVRRKKSSSEVSSQNISGQEANQTAGSGRDVLTSIKNMPGINSVSVFNGIGDGIVIRGSNQEDSIIAVGDHEIPSFYHFLGFESIIEPELVESVDYIAGGFSALYGDALGGVVALNLRDPRTDRLGGYVNLSMMSGSFLLEGPIGKNDSFAVGLKRGFIDAYVRAVEKYDENNENNINYVEYPSYFDGTALFKHEISAGNQIRLTGIGSKDSLEVSQDDDSVSERFSNRLAYESRFTTLIGEWEYRNGALTSILSPMVTYIDSTIDAGNRAYFKHSVNSYRLSEKMIYEVNPTHRLTGGVRLLLDYADLSARWFAPEKEGEISYDYYDQEMRTSEKLSLFYPSVFLMDQIKLGNWMITPGINASYDTYNSHALVDPRLSLKYKLTSKTTLKGATGQYSKRPDLDETIAPWGTKGLKPERSIHGVLGVEHQFTKAISLDVQGYYKHFDDLVVRIDPDDPSRYANEGTGKAYGAEFLLRHQMTDRFFGWLAYSYSVARRKDGPDKEERYFDNDITHNFKAVANYKLTRTWSFGLRYEYATGKPYTDLHNVETVYDVDSDFFKPVYDGPINEERLKPYHQLDLRIDKYWIFNSFVLSTYLDIRNVLQTRNVIGIAYNKDYTQDEEVEAVTSQVPLIFLGLKVDF